MVLDSYRKYRRAIRAQEAVHWTDFDVIVRDNRLDLDELMLLYNHLDEHYRSRLNSLQIEISTPRVYVTG